MPSVPTAVSVAFVTLVPTAQIRCPALFASFTIRHVSAVISICSESILCFVKSSTSISLKFPRPQCRVMKAFRIPDISIRFNISLVKWRPVAGAVTAPSDSAKTHWKSSMSSSVTGRGRPPFMSSDIM